MQRLTCCKLYSIQIEVKQEKVHCCKFMNLFLSPISTAVLILAEWMLNLNPRRLPDKILFSYICDMLHRISRNGSIEIDS